MALTSPGVEVSVINESFYVPSDAGTTPLFIVASGQEQGKRSRRQHCGRNNNSKRQHCLLDLISERINRDFRRSEILHRRFRKFITRL
jgi:hypothetical protein